MDFFLNLKKSYEMAELYMQIWLQKSKTELFWF